jgi:hypothetical protein
MNDKRRPDMTRRGLMGALTTLFAAKALAQSATVVTSNAKTDPADCKHTAWRETNFQLTSPEMGVKVGDLTADKLDELTNGTGAPVIGTVQNLGPIVDVCLGCGLIRIH